MCVSEKTNPSIAASTPSKDSEATIARKSGWFSIKYFHENKVRYVFADWSSHGIVWGNTVFFVLLHFYFVHAIYQLFAEKLWYTWIFVYWYGWTAGLGVTVGAHRLWSHRTYQAKLPLRIFLGVLNTMAGQNDLYTWVRDHRLHHKFTETDADPHNSRRGAFFAHVGWLLTRKHPDILIKGKTISNDDILSDPVIYYQRKYYIPLYLIFRLALPIYVPICFWNETVTNAISSVFAQYITSLHVTWFVNSAAHIFGDRPYNSKIQPRENFWVNATALGEGFHNYHHTFPWDYAISEDGWKYYDPARKFIDFMAFIGQAYNLKKASPELVNKLKAKEEADNANNNAIDWYAGENHPYHEPHGFC